jgi:hypothetical protein
VSVILSLENFPPYILSYINKNKYLGKYLVLYRYAIFLSAPPNLKSWIRPCMGSLHSSYCTCTSREANVSFRNSSHKAKNIYARADKNNPPRLCQLFLASRISRHIFLATTTKTNTSGNTLFYTDIMSNKKNNKHTNISSNELLTDIQHK